MDLLLYAHLVKNQFLMPVYKHTLTKPPKIGMVVSYTKINTDHFSFFPRYTNTGGKHAKKTTRCNNVRFRRVYCA